mgnify:CR=1 FL=1
MNTVQPPSVKKNFALSTAYQILILVVPFVTTPYVSRVLGADGIGVYSFTNSISLYFTMFAALGTMSYGTREISRARDNREQLSRLFWEIELLVVCTTLFCIILWGVWVLIAPKYNIIYLVLTMSLLNTIADISWFFTGLEQFKYIVLRNSIVKIAGIILLFVFIREKDDLTLYIFLMTFTNLLGALSMWMYIPRMVDKVEWRTIRIKTHFKETLVYFIPTIATSVYTVLNKVLLGFMGGDIRENGYYEQATKIIIICQTLTFTALNSVLGARIAYLFAENKIDEIRLRIEKSLNYILLVGLGLCMGLMAIAPRFVPWFFGPGYDSTIILIQILSPIVLIIGISNCLGSQYYTPAGLRKQSARYIVYGAIENLLLNIILIPYYGAKGAVMGSLAAEFTISVLYLYNCKGYMTLRQIVCCGWQKAVAGFVMFGVVWYICGVVGNATFAVLGSIIIGSFVYTIMLLLLHDRFSLEMVDMVRTKLLLLVNKDK